MLYTEREWNDADMKHDAAWFERNYAADVTDVSSRTGALSTKGQVLSSVKDDKTVLEAADLSDLNVRKEGDTAVVTGINHVRGRDDKGQAFDRWYRFTDVFVKRKCLQRKGHRYSNGCANTEVLRWATPEPRLGRKTRGCE